MSGFFTREEIPINNQINRVSCERCGLHLKCRNPKIEMSGEGKKGIHVILDSPSNSDDEKGLHLSGKSGKFLIAALKKLKIDARKDCTFDYAVRCMPPKGEATKMHVEACTGKMWENLLEVKPKVILLFGNNALESFLKPRWVSTVGEMATWRGFAIPDRTVKAWVCPMYSPKFVTMNDKHPVLKQITQDDLSYAIKHINIEFPEYIDERQQIRILNDEESQVRWLKTLNEKSLVSETVLAVDYETTGLKPHALGHQIACISMCYDENEAVSMWYPSMTPVARRWVKKILTSSKILKVAHNIKYEIAWTKNILGYDLHPTTYCSMQAAHVIDNRPSIVGLKFQSYVYFGLMNYEAHIHPFLESEGGGNSFNNVFKAPRTELQIYNGIDSLTQIRLVNKQLQETAYALY